MAFLIFLAILAAVIVFVTRPLWRPTAQTQMTELARTRSAEIVDLEAARDSKYREIRDAELDHRTGKLSAEDFEVIDRSLRAEALDILNELDRARGRPARSEELPANAATASGQRGPAEG